MAWARLWACVCDDDFQGREEEREENLNTKMDNQNHQPLRTNNVVTNLLNTPGNLTGAGTGAITSQDLQRRGEESGQIRVNQILEVSLPYGLMMTSFKQWSSTHRCVRFTQRCNTCPPESRDHSRGGCGDDDGDQINDTVTDYVQRFRSPPSSGLISINSVTNLMFQFQLGGGG